MHRLEVSSGDGHYYQVYLGEDSVRDLVAQDTPLAINGHYTRADALKMIFDYVSGQFDLGIIHQSNIEAVLITGSYEEVYDDSHLSNIKVFVNTTCIAYMAINI